MTTPTTETDAAGLRCPHCGARNGPAAAWCNLCLEPIAAEPDAVEAATPAPSPAAQLPPPAGSRDVGDQPPPPPPAAAATEADARFRTTGTGLEWACEVCDAWNDVDEPACHDCGAALASMMDDGEDTIRDVPEPQLVLASLVLPGSGLWLLGRQGIGGGIALLYLLFAGGAVALLTSAGDAGRAVVAVTPLVLGAVVLLVGSTLDAVNVGRGGSRVLLDSRALLWCTVAVLGLVTLLFLTTALTATRL